MFCSNCGREINDELNFCPKCGTNLHKNISEYQGVNEKKNNYFVLRIISLCLMGVSLLALLACIIVFACFQDVLTITITNPEELEDFYKIIPIFYCTYAFIFCWIGGWFFNLLNKTIKNKKITITYAILILILVYQISGILLLIEATCQKE